MCEDDSHEQGKTGKLWKLEMKAHQKKLEKTPSAMSQLLHDDAMICTHRHFEKQNHKMVVETWHTGQQSTERVTHKGPQHTNPNSP